MNEHNSILELIWIHEYYFGPILICWGYGQTRMTSYFTLQYDILNDLFRLIRLKTRLNSPCTRWFLSICKCFIICENSPSLNLKPKTLAVFFESKWPLFQAKIKIFQAGKNSLSFGPKFLIWGEIVSHASSPSSHTR